MDDEPDLPDLDLPSTQSALFKAPELPGKRKRIPNDGRAHASNSSDPAVFSSDDNPDLDNYVQGRHRKKRYVGTWFEQRPASSDSGFTDELKSRPPRKRTLQRQLDSGVWMGSDESTDLDDFVPECDQQTSTRGAALIQLPPPNPLEAAAQQKIREAVEQGNETIDLSYVPTWKNPLLEACLRPPQQFIYSPMF